MAMSKGAQKRWIEEMSILGTIVNSVEQLGDDYAGEFVRKTQFGDLYAEKRCDGNLLYTLVKK